MDMQIPALLAAAILVLMVSGCADRPEAASNNSEPLGNESASDLVRIANPASTYCAEQGGELINFDTPEGEAGYCVLSGNVVCEEWTYFRNGTCVPPQ